MVYIRIMDIAELSRKMEATPLGNHSNCSPYIKPVINDSFIPRLTRSQSNKEGKILKNEPEINIELKKNHCKINKVEKIYLNKKPKVVHKNLETIYEDPIWKKGNTVLLGTAKVKRSIYLDREFRITSKQKSKLRKMKMKRLGKKTKQFKMSDEEFRNEMLRIENYINGTDVEIKCRNEVYDVEFDNCDTYENCNELENGNAESEMSESKELENQIILE